MGDGGLDAARRLQATCLAMITKQWREEGGGPASKTKSYRSNSR